MPVYLNFLILAWCHYVGIANSFTSFPNTFLFWSSPHIFIPNTPLPENKKITRNSRKVQGSEHFPRLVIKMTPPYYWILRTQTKHNMQKSSCFFPSPNCKTTTAKMVFLVVERASFRRLFIEEQFPKFESSALDESQSPFVGQNNLA